MSCRPIKRRRVGFETISIVALALFVAVFSCSDSTFANANTAKETKSGGSTPAEVVSESAVLVKDASSTLPQRGGRLSSEDEKTFDALVDLYVYAYPLVLSNEIKRETTANVFFSATNETAYFPKLPNARFRATECPNVDSLLAIAWLDLNKEAQIIVLPAAPNEKFSLEIVDGWTNVVASFDDESAKSLTPFDVGTRKIKALALVGPTSSRPANLPSEVKIIESPSDLALIWTRVFVGTAGYRGANGMRPIVQTLYEFETIPYSVFASEIKINDAIQNDDATSTPLESETQPTSAPISSDAISPQTDAELNRALESTESLDSNSTRQLETELQSEMNAELTPPQTNNFAELEKRFVARSSSSVRYAAPTLDDEKETEKKTEKEAQKETEKKTEKEAQKDDESTKATFRELVDEAVTRGERDLDQAAEDASRFAKRTWRDAREDEREALDNADGAYLRIKRWFRDEFGRDVRDWDEAAREFDAGARADWARFVRDRDAIRPTRRWFELPVERVGRMSPEMFLKTFVELLKTNPPSNADAAIVESMKTLGIVPGESLKKLDPRVLQLSRGAFAIARKKIEIAAYSQIWRNATPTNWIVFKNLGAYGTDYLLRAGVASVFIGANTEKNVVYPFAFLDASSEPLDGDAGAYVVHFPAGQTPPTDFLWSLTLYGGDRYLAPNRWEKYGVRSDAPLVYNPDGSLDVLIQQDEPKENPVNWIPAPRGRFVLALRIYRPQESVLNGTWTPPAVVKIEKKNTEQ